MTEKIEEQKGKFSTGKVYSANFIRISNITLTILIAKEKKDSHTATKKG